MPDEEPGGQYAPTLHSDAQALPWLDAPVTVPHVPAAQSVHDDAAADENDPALHGVHAEPLR